MYTDHSTLDSGTSKSVVRNVTDLVRETGSEDTLQAVLADGTNVNTGWRNGAIVRVERDLEKNIQWLICILHMNELPLRHLFTAMDGGHDTTAPKTFKGPLGQKLCGDVHQLPVVKFQPIPTIIQQPVCVGVFRALQLLRLLSALIVYASLAQLRTGIIDDVKTNVT